LFQAKNCAAQSRLCGAGKAAITETSTLALMVAITLQATPALTAIIGAAMLRRRLLRRRLERVFNRCCRFRRGTRAANCQRSA